MARTASLSARLMTGAALIALIPLAALTVAFTVLAGREIRKQLDVALLARAQNFAGLVQSSILDPLSRDTALRGWAAHSAVMGALRNPAACNQFLGMAARGRLVVAAQLLDATGKPLCGSAADLPGTAPEAAWFRSALDGGLSSSGIEQRQGRRALTLALGVIGPDGRPAGVLRAWYDWNTLAGLIDTAALQAHVGDENVRLQLSLGNDVLYDSAASSVALAGLGRRGVDERGDLLFAWARNDTAASDPGGGFAYVCRIARGAAFASVRNLVRAIVALAVLGGGLAILAAWLLARRLVRPLLALGLAMERVVAHGDLTQEIDVGRPDEIGRLAASFAALVQKLRDIPRSLQESVASLTGEVGRLTAASRAQNERVARQVAAVQQTHVTAQEIRQTSVLAAEKAETVLGAAQHADELAQAGETAVTESLGHLQQVLARVEAISASMTELNESTRRIAGITDAVKQLADQSNMLALNAAVEAVRAGEHGRGFSVVAREIRSLADQSIEATQRVGEILEAIRSTAGRAVTITQEGSRAISDNLTRMRGSGESLRELGNIARENASSVRQIAAAVGQQNTGIDQVFSAVRDLSASMNDLERLIEQSDASVQALIEVSAQIDQIVARFRV